MSKLRQFAELAPRTVSSWMSRCALACALALTAWLGMQVLASRHRADTREALIRHQPELSSAFQALDKLARRQLVEAVWRVLPISQNMSVDDGLTRLQHLERRAMDTALLSWLPPLFRDRWLSGDATTPTRAGTANVLLYLYATASVTGGLTRASVLEHLEVRNVLAGFCIAPVLPERMAHMCTEVRSYALLGGWRQAFLAHDISRDERPYIDRPSMVARLGKLTVARVKVCNLTPYAIDHSVASMVQPQVVETQGWIGLEPGSCHESMRESVDVEPGLAIAAESQRREMSVVRFVSRHANGQGAEKIRWEGRDLLACVGKATRLTDVADVACASGERSQGFVGGVEHRETEWRFNLVHPGTHLDPRSLDSEVGGESALLEEARQLSSGVRRQVEFDEHWGHRTVPYYLDSESEDVNGVFAVGVRLRDVAAQTIFGDDNLLQEDDLLVALQGRPVYSHRDLALSVIEHASSRTGGAEVPMSAVVLRGGQRMTVAASFAFNTDYWGRDHRRAATFFGFSDPILFSATPEAMCSVPIALNALAKGLDWLADKLCSGSAAPNCVSRKAQGPAPLDFKLCVWRARQYRALARQTQDGAFMIASFIGLVVPSPLKLVAWSPVNRIASRGIGPGWLATGISNAAIEVPETWIQEMRAAAPTATLSTRMTNANRAAVFASAIGLVVGGVLAR